MIYRILLLLVLAGCIWGWLASRKRAERAHVTPQPELATLPMPVVGYIVRAADDATWCVGTNRPDVKPGWNVIAMWPASQESLSGQLGEARGTCLTADSVPGQHFFKLVANGSIRTDAPGVVMGMMAWRLSTNGYVGEFDNQPGQDRVMECGRHEKAYVFVVNDSGPARTSYYRELPLSADETCDSTQTRLILEHMPASPLVVPQWAYNMVEFPPQSRWMLLNGDLLSATGVQDVTTSGACGDESHTVAPAPIGDYQFLFANLPLTAGKVESARILTQYERDGYADPDSIVIVFRNDTAIVKRAHVDGIHVWMQSHGDSVAFFDSDFEDEGRSNVEWAGDLDRDGKLDIALFATSKYSVRGVMLFLSKQRRAKEWPIAAEYWQAAC